MTRDTRETPQRFTGMASSYYTTMPYQASSSSYGNHSVRRTRSVKSEDAVSLHGPLDVAGSVKSGRSITLNGDFTVEDKIEAYGSIDITGNVNCGYVLRL